MKNDTSPSARQPYSYADALRSLLIIPPSDRQPPEPAEPEGSASRRPACSKARPPATSTLAAAREVSSPLAPWRSLCRGPAGSTLPVRHRSAVRAVGTDLLAEVTPRRSCPCSAARRRSPAGRASKRGRVWWLKLAAGHPAAPQPLARLVFLQVKHMFSKIIQVRPCPQEDSSFPWWLMAVSCYYKIPT